MRIAVEVIFLKIVERMKSLLSDRDLRQNQFAKDLGISPQTLNGYLQGRRSFPHDVLLRAAELLHVTMDYLYGLSDDGGKPLRLKPEERVVVEEYRGLKREQREEVWLHIRALQEKNKKGSDATG